MTTPVEPLEQQLVMLAHRLDTSAVSGLADDVAHRIAAGGPVRPVHWSSPPRRRALVAGAVLLIAVAVVFAVAPTRRTVAHWFGIGDTRIEHVPVTPTLPSVPTSATSATSTVTTTSTVATSSSAIVGSASSPLDSVPALTLDLGQPATALQASTRTGVGVPGSPLLGTPRGIYVITPPVSGQVVVVYPPSATVPASPATGVGALLAAWPATFERAVFAKVAGPATEVDAVQVTTAGGDTVDGVWLGGAPHEYAFVDNAGQFVFDSLRLATNTLLWEDHGVSYRLEADITEAAALAIATTVTH